MPKIKYGDKIITTNDPPRAQTLYVGEPVELDADGNLRADPKKILSVWIANAADVAHYEVTPYKGLFLHALRFRDGGRARYACRKNGRLVDFSAKNVAANTIMEGAILVLSMRLA